MTVLPHLRTDLADAARYQYGDRRRRRRLAVTGRLLRFAAAAAVIVAMVALALPLLRTGAHDETAAPLPDGVPPATLQLSRDLMAAAPADPSILPAAAIRRAAADMLARTPYPPGDQDDLSWLTTSGDRSDMAAVSTARDLEFTLEFRAACSWARYWLAGTTATRPDAALVLAYVPSWPSVRDPKVTDVRNMWAGVADAAQTGRADAIEQVVAANCRS